MSDSTYIQNVSDALGLVVYNYLVKNNITNVSSSTISSLVENWYDDQSRETIALSAVQPDIRQIIEQLQIYLSTHDSWKDTITAATGQMIIDFIAGVGGLNQLSIERAVHETMLKTAVMDSSVIANARNLGVHVIRKTPAGVTVTLYNSSSSSIITIPAYSKWNINGTDFFNRTPIVFNAGVTTLTDQTLYEGSVVTATATSSGETFQRLEIGTQDFTISDIDISITVDNQVYTRTTDGLYHYSNSDYVFDENTLPSGNVEIRFGNNTYGVSPKIGSTIYLTYVETNGLSANSASTGLAVTCSSSSSITGITTSTISGGSNEKDSKFYKMLAPGMYSSLKRMVTRQDHVSIGSTYPGIIDVLFRGQSETYPTDKNYMNVVTVTPLATNTASAWTAGEVISSTGVYRSSNGCLYVSASTGTCGAVLPTHTTGTISDGGVSWTFYAFWTNEPWSSAKFADYVAFIEGTTPYNKAYKMFPIQYIQANPIPIGYTISADLYCTKDSDLVNMASYIKQQLISNNTPTVGSLGKSVKLSDVYKWLKITHKTYGTVDYFELNAPSADVTASALQFVLLNPNITLNMHYSDRTVS
jgi:hypothetical protein